MFKNKKNVHFIHRPKKYSLYIFIHFATYFFIWFVALFMIIFAVKQIDSYENYTLKQNLFFSFVRAFGTLLDNTAIVILIGSIFFLLRQMKNFNFNILKTFGITSWQILKPMILFLILFSFIKIFFLHPMCIKFENYQKIQMKKWKKDYINTIKNGTKFIVVDEKNSSDYMIINGTYNWHDKNKLKFSDAVLLMYKNKELKTVYSAQHAVVSFGKILIKDVDITVINGNSAIQTMLKSKQLDTQLTVKELIVRINNMNKMKKTVLLNLYDHLKLINQKYKSYIKNESEIQARIYISEEIVAFINSILCCFMVLLFCLSSDRNSNFSKKALLCFITYFIILRFFHALENIIYISNCSALCVIIFSLLLCISAYLSILNNDWHGYYYDTIKNKILSKLLKLRTKLTKISKYSVIQYVFRN